MERERERAISGDGKDVNDCAAKQSVASHHWILNSVILSESANKSQAHMISLFTTNPHSSPLFNLNRKNDTDNIDHRLQLI